MLIARRGLATVIDYSAVAGALGVLAAVTLLRRSRQPAGERRDPDPATLRLMVAAGVTVPLSCALAVADATGGTPGKRALGLTVEDATSGSTPTFQQALVRSALKTAIPWELGHQAVWDFRSGHTRRGSVLAAGAYLALGAQAAAILRNRPTYADRLANTQVHER
ncbi:RDD family protein [Kribbella italica]|uniref:Putative RDD family membrane protein YckC n=1 Tax=Kribbella italica TaxID=1540520 RepID=A0A7W9JB09_9ACTN|nr:RDD family protein [Kribbella italica]MBB5838853.1 putative RDD family membrane protein YckC [Kribbella italica]